MAKSRLTRSLIDKICDLLRERRTFRYICDVLGIHESTFWRWRRRGEVESSGIYHELSVALASVEVEVCEALSQVVYGAALDGKVVKRLRRKTSADGDVRTEQTVIVYPPNPHLALKILERKEPGTWSPLGRVSVDWRDYAKSQGVDPGALEETVSNAILYDQRCADYLAKYAQETGQPLESVFERVISILESERASATTSTDPPRPADVPSDGKD